MSGMFLQKYYTTGRSAVSTERKAWFYAAGDRLSPPIPGALGEESFLLHCFCYYVIL
jgi:hypothetical protein